MTHPSLRLAAARHVLGLALGDELVQAAHDALDSGVYSYSLGELAANTAKHWSDRESLFLSALAELEIAIPDPSDALKTVLADLLRPVAEGTKDPVGALRRLFDEVYLPLTWDRSGRPQMDFGPVRELLRLRHQYEEYLVDSPTDAPSSNSDRDARAVFLARQWCQLHGQATLDPSWLTSTVIALALAIEDDEAFDRLPILADALEEAGCNDLEMLAHCRSAIPHDGWCWVAEAVTGGPYSEHRINTWDTVHIRTNPGMYIGDTGPGGLEYLLFRLVANSFAEITAGFGRAIRVTLHSDGAVTVSDDGRTVANEVDEVRFRDLFACMGCGGDPMLMARDRIYYTVANALSDRFHAEIRSIGQSWRQHFSRGSPTSVAECVGPATGPGLTVTFHPDPEIFGDAQIDRVAVRARLQQYAFLNSGIEVLFTDAVGTMERFHYEDGVTAFVRSLVADGHPLHPDVITARGEHNGVRYEMGLQWCSETRGRIMSFVNCEATIHGGTHVVGLRAAVTRSFNAALRRSGIPTLTGDEALHGLVAVVAVWLEDPAFEGATRTSIGNPLARTAVQVCVRRVLAERFVAEPDLVRTIAESARR